MIVTVDELAVAHLTTQPFRKHKRIKRQHQLVVPSEVVIEGESNRDELCWFVSLF